MKHLRELVGSEQIRLSISDKGGEFVVIPHQLDIAITENHLRDMSIYRPSSRAEFQKQFRSLNREWIKTAKAAHFSRDMTARLKIDLPACPVLYVLIKTHKLQSSADLDSSDPTTFKVRPIISNVGGPTDRVGWFLNPILVQPLNYILSSTCVFL